MVRRRAELAAARRQGVRSPDQLAEQAARHPNATRRFVAAAARFPVRKPGTAPPALAAGVSPAAPAPSPAPPGRAVKRGVKL